MVRNKWFFSGLSVYVEGLFLCENIVKPVARDWGSFAGESNISANIYGMHKENNAETLAFEQQCKF